MPQPEITFFCELGPIALEELFAQPGLIERLAARRYKVALAILDFSPQRAAVVRRLTAAGVAVVAWLLLPIDAGYWFNLSNYPQAIARYHEFRAWAERERLRFFAVGLDFEPSLKELHAARGKGALHIFNRALLAQRHALYPAARDAYLELAATIRHDGYELHTYQYPPIVDDRRWGTTLIQRMLDVIDLPADLEVLMLYTSPLWHGRLDALGAAYIRSYGPHADGIAIGVTGGGVVLDPLTGLTAPRMTDASFQRDLRVAAAYTDSVHIFSLEGCVERGWLEAIEHIDWDAPVRIAWRYRAGMWVIRSSIGAILWASRYGWTALGWLGWLVVAGLLIQRRVGRWRTQRRRP